MKWKSFLNNSFIILTFRQNSEFKDLIYDDLIVIYVFFFGKPRTMNKKI